MMSLKLIKLSKTYEKQLGEMIDEWKADQELNHTNHSPWAIFKNDYHDFDYYLENLEVKEEAEGKVPDSVFFLLDAERDKLLGAINIRHYLNEDLYKEGGHIGDGIRPSERRKGYATEMIRLALIECKKLGIEKVLITCDRDNIASAKSIINNVLGPYALHSCASNVTDSFNRITGQKVSNPGFYLIVVFIPLIIVLNKEDGE